MQKIVDRIKLIKKIVERRIAEAEDKIRGLPDDDKEKDLDFN